MNEMISCRWKYGVIALFCSASVGFALYMQHIGLVSPCPLCIFQRVGFMTCGTLAFLACIFPMRSRVWFWPSTVGISALCGAGVSIRHIQIQQSLATAKPLSCGADLGYMLQVESIPSVFSDVLAGHGDCTVIDWQLGFVTLPMIALAGFVLVLVTAFSNRLDL